MKSLERHAWIGVAGLGIVMGVLITQDSIVGGVLVACFLLASAYWMAPWRGGRSVRQRDLDTLPEERRRVVIYWRPGCMYCSRLRRSLGREGRQATWVNIWQDGSAAAFVSSANNGDEVVPTVVIDGVPHTNPDPRLVRLSLTS